MNPDLDSFGLRRESSEIPFSIFSFAAAFESVTLNLTCIECDSPGMTELIKFLSAENRNSDVSAFVKGVFHTVTTLVGGEYLAFNMDRWVAESRQKCPHSADYRPNAQGIHFQPFETVERSQSVKPLVILVIVAGCLFLAIVTIAMALNALVRRRHRKWLGTLSHERILLLWKHQKTEKEGQAQSESLSTSLYCSPDIPYVVRVVVPIIIVGNIALFLVGHLTSAASVNLLVSFAGETYRSDSFFEFSMAGGFLNLWAAGGYELAILVLIFSGIWPYTKQLISLALWFVSPNTLSSYRRGNIYLWLDFLAKWSMVDIFTLLISLIAFRVTVNRYVPGQELFYGQRFSLS